MGWILIVFSALASASLTFLLVMIMNAKENVQPSYQLIHEAMPFWNKNVWILIVILLIINILTVFYGRFLLKHPDLNNKYLWFSITLLVLIVFGIPLVMQYLIIPVLMNFYSISQVMF